MEKLFVSMENEFPASDKLQKVADYFGVSTDYLLGRTDNPSIDKGEPEEEFSTFFRIDTKDIPEDRKIRGRTERVF